MSILPDKFPEFELSNPVRLKINQILDYLGSSATTSARVVTVQGSNNGQDGRGWRPVGDGLRFWMPPIGNAVSRSEVPQHILDMHSASQEKELTESIDEEKASTDEGSIKSND